MKCTRCTQPVKPIVAIDIDGTMGDYHGHFLNFLEQYLGYQNTNRNYGGIPRFRDWATDFYGISVEEFRTIKLAYRQGAQKRSMPVFPGMTPRELCGAIQVAGAELWITTTRPYLRLDNIDPDTRHWLDRNGIYPDGMIYDEDKYIMLSEQVDPERVVAVLDDLPEMMKQARSCFGQDVPLMRRTRYNELVLELHDVDSLGQAQIVITNRIEEWYKENGR